MSLKISEITSHLNQTYDVFITSASYEDRCLSITDSIVSKINFNFKFVAIVSVDKNIIENNFRKFIDTYGFEPIEINSKNQVQSALNIANTVRKVFQIIPNASFLVDVSTFRRQTLLILMRLLRNLLTIQNRINFIYTPAKEYSVGLPESEKWLTKGIIDVNSVFGYSGIIRPSRPYHLILLMGYEVERASTLINVYEPSKITIGYGRRNHSVRDEHYELNKKRFDKLVDEFPTAESFEFSCISVDDCKVDIMEQARKYRNHNIIISPMNNKISTMACGLAAFENDEIQLAIAIPAFYNIENYSTPSEICYPFEIEKFIKK